LSRLTEPADWGLLAAAVAPGPSPDPDRRLVAEDVFGVEPSGDIIMVLPTPPGVANAVGLALDWPAWGDILGTIAVDDAIFVAVKDTTAARNGGAEES